MSRPMNTSQQQRFVSVLTGTLLLLVAVLAYSNHGGLFSSPAEGKCSLSRLRIAEFKPIYDRQILLGGAQASERGQPQSTGNGGLYLIDVRSATSFASGHIRGAISLPEPELETRINSIVSPGALRSSDSAVLRLTYGAYKRPCGAPPRADELPARVGVGWRVGRMAS